MFVQGNALLNIACASIHAWHCRYLVQQRGKSDRSTDIFSMSVQQFVLVQLTNNCCYNDIQSSIVAKRFLSTFNVPRFLCRHIVDTRLPSAYKTVCNVNFALSRCLNLYSTWYSAVDSSLTPTKKKENVRLCDIHYVR